MFSFYIFYIPNYAQPPLKPVMLIFEQKREQKSPSAKAKGLEMVRLPLLDSFRTFKGNIALENVRLNQLILQY